MKDTRYPEKKKSNNSYKTAGVVLVVLIIIAVTVFLFRNCSGETAAVASPTTLTRWRAAGTKPMLTESSKV